MLRRAVQALRRQDWTAVVIELAAESDEVLRKGPHLLASLQLRIAYLESDLGNMTVYYALDIREPLHRLAEQKP